MKDTRQPYGELWLDKGGDAHFDCHTQGEDFPATKAALQKFIALLQRQIDDEAACPLFTGAEVPA